MSKEFLSNKNWKLCVESTPIFGIDIILFSKPHGILMGKRINDPAKDKFFVPGGRVYKNETREEAFNRIVKNEIGLNLLIGSSINFGLFEHFYNTNFISDKNKTTHYIIEARLIELKSNINSINLKEQHSNSKWINISENNNDVHFYSQQYLDKMVNYIKNKFY